MKIMCFHLDLTKEIPFPLKILINSLENLVFNSGNNARLGKNLS